MRSKRITAFLFAAALMCSAAAFSVSAYDTGNLPADGIVLAEKEPQELTDISLAEFEYTQTLPYGSKIRKPEVKVSCNGNKLNVGTDYTLSYTFDEAAMKGTVTVKGLGNYTGSKKLSFSIAAPEVKAPANLRCSDANTHIFCLRWDTVKGADGYELEYYTGSAWKSIAQVGGSKKYYKYSSNSLTPGTAYQIRIRAFVKYAGKKVYSSYTKAYATTDPEAVKNIRQTSANEKGMTLLWDKVSGASGYKVYRWSPDTGKYEVIGNVTSCKFVVSDRIPGQKNTYKVRAYKKIKGSDVVFHGALTAFKGTAACSVVPNIKGTVKLGKVTISWSSVSKASGYEVYYTNAKGSDPVVLATVDAKTTSYTTSAIPKGANYKVKVKAISRYGTAVAKSKYPPGAVVRVFDTPSYNSVLDSYVNSSSLTVTNGQGYRIPDYLKNNLNYYLTYLGGVCSFAMLDLESGTLISSNGKYYMGTASTVKMPYMLYCLKEMEDGYPTMDTTMVYSQQDYHGGSGIIQTYSFGTVLTLRDIFNTIFYYSDNIGYYMLQRMFGIEGYNNYISSLGCRTTMSWYDRWGYICATDSCKEWIQMYNYFKNGKYGSFMKNGLMNSTSSNFRIGLYYKYPVYSKCGWTDVYHHDTAVVEAEHPYVLICFTNRVSASRLQAVARAADAIHDDLWRYLNS